MFPRRHRRSYHSQYFQDPSPEPYVVEHYEPKDFAEKMSFFLIRPSRFTYNEQLLMPPVNRKGFMAYEQHRIPFKLSLYKPNEMRYVILYLHGNSASRIEGHQMLRDLPKDAGLACFDFSACGNRKDSQYVTLGQDQCKDVDIAAKYLKGLGYQVAGWGRSMGAVSLLLSTECDVLVVDSPYSSLSDVCWEITKSETPTAALCCVACLYPCVFSWLKNVVYEKSGLRVEDMEIVDRMKQNPASARRKILFIAGSSDTMVAAQHTKLLHERFTGVKKLRIFDGNHNSPRPRHLIKQCHSFIEMHLTLNNPVQLLSPRRVPGPRVTSPKMLKVRSERKPMKTEMIEVQRTEQLIFPRVVEEQNSDKFELRDDTERVERLNDEQTSIHQLKNSQKLITQRDIKIDDIGSGDEP